MTEHLGYSGRRPNNERRGASPQNEPYPDYEVRTKYRRPIPKNEYSIGIGVTTHNRTENLRKCITNILITTDGIPTKIVIVDDASDVPVEHADFRFEHNVGVAKAKNKCLELLDECDYIFLFDDDTYPTQWGWWHDYVESGFHHLSFTFDTLHDGRPNRNTWIGEHKGHSYFKNPCGCMLFMTRELIKKIGGFDLCFGSYGNEHIDFSVRAYMNGMVPHPFMDVSHSLTLFHSMDYFCETETSVQSKMGIWNTKAQIGNKGHEFVPYKSMGEPFVILTSYFNYSVDPQRLIQWDSDVNNVLPLAKSVSDHGGTIYIFHNCFENVPKIKNVHFVLVKDVDVEFCPNVGRYLVYKKFLAEVAIDVPIFMTDSTDVICLSGPGGVLEGKIYIGDEHNTFVNNAWMRNTQMPHAKVIPDYESVMELYGEEPLLNCGIIGGYYDDVMLFLDLYTTFAEGYFRGLQRTVDMALANYIFYKYMRDKIIHGEPINTRFKYFEKKNGVWFQHK